MATYPGTHFVKQTSFSVEYAPSHITNWRSSRTGLQITYINQPSPVVNGYFAVATEIMNDSGCPHTLEHLVFMGSKKFPYKGLLDSLGNKFFSQTNAWTAVDQTVYTLTTAGWDGFNTLLPMYLDHLFHPTLTKEAFLTEVYHIDGKGKEKGVVFSEMQGIESQSWAISALEMQRTIYPKNSGYQSETGGLLREIRHLTNDQIKEFHNLSYRPENLCVVITGSIDVDELMTTMAGFDNELKSLPTTPQKRPFVDSTPILPLTSNVIKEVQFPEKDETMGEIIIGWIGPDANDNLMNVAVDIVGTYFIDSEISVFNKNLIETENPLATSIDYYTDDFSKTGLFFTASGVPVEKLEEIDTKMKHLLKLQSDPKILDLTYIRQVLKQQKLKLVYSTEKSASTFSNVAISDFIYGNPNGSTLKNSCLDLKEYEILDSWTADDWTALIDRFFVKNCSVTVIGRPSEKLYESQKRENKQILSDIKKKYGKEGLDSFERELKLAQEVNDRPLPDSISSRYRMPDPSKISFIETSSYKSGSNNLQGFYTKDDSFAELLKADCPKDFPVPFHFETYDSQFTTINLLMSSSKAEPRLLQYMSILEEIFSFPINFPDGKHLSYEEVVSKLNDDLIEYLLDNGFDGSFLELVNVKLKFESKKYKEAIYWLNSILKHTVIEESRIKVVIEKIVNSLPEKKRSGELMMYSLEYRTLYESNSLKKAHDCIKTEIFYKDLLKKIEDGGFSEIKADLNKLKDQLFDLSNLKVFVIGGVDCITKPISTWNSFIKEFDTGPGSDPIDKIPRSFDLRSTVGRKCSGEAYLVTVPATESTYLETVTPIPTDYLDEDIFKIVLAAKYLSNVEGPLWRGVRGAGLAYDASISCNVESGYLKFLSYRGSDAQQALLVAKTIVTDYSNGTSKFDESNLENAVAAIVNMLANSESNNYDAANGKIADTIFKKRGANYVKFFLAKLKELTAEDMVQIVKKYFVPLFSPKTSLVFACVPPTKAESLKASLSEGGYKIHIEEIGASSTEADNDNMSCLESDEESQSSDDDTSDSETSSETASVTSSETEAELRLT